MSMVINLKTNCFHFQSCCIASPIKPLSCRCPSISIIGFVVDALSLSFVITFLAQSFPERGVDDHRIVHKDDRVDIDTCFFFVGTFKIITLIEIQNSYCLDDTIDETIFGCDFRKASRGSNRVEQPVINFVKTNKTNDKITS